MAELDITYRCNCRCQMCQRWKDPRRDELSVAEYRQLAVTFNNLGVHQVSIAGGEPLLRDDVFHIIASLSRHGMSVNLCTNGILLHKYPEEICRSGATCVTVSLDGVTAESHDTIRGVSDSLRLIEKGIRMLLRRPFAKRPVVRVRMTVSNINAHEIRSFYDKWEKVADDVLLQPAHFCRDSYYSGLTDETYRLNPQILAAQISGTPLAEDGYMTQLITSLCQLGTLPNQLCYAGVLMVRIDPWGNVYPCLEQHVCVGSVREQDFRVIWNSDAFNHVRRKLTSERMCRCWYNNTALIGHYGGALAGTGGTEIRERIKGLVWRNHRSASPAKGN